MTCLTTKKTFEAVNPHVVVLKNGRYAYNVECPWKGKNNKTLYAYKFCGQAAYTRFLEREETEESEHELEESEHENEKSEQELSDPPLDNA